MNRPLFFRTFGSLRARLIVCAAGLLVWGAALPLVYSAFGKSLGDFMASNPLLQQFSQFGGGDVLSLGGSIGLGFIHPITLLLMGIFAVGFPLAAVAGERQRGTLEVLLARPISRHSLYLTLFVVGALILGVLMAMELIGAYVGATATGVSNELHPANMVLLWFNGWLLFLAIMAITFALSVSFDRLGPALGITLGFVVVSYFLDVIGSLWPAAAWIQTYSVFDLVRAKHVLASGLIPEHVLALILITAAAVGYAWFEFPRRDLAAPS
jgi:ABC-type transport system involved in multi-copper enzyme maturation permease subunit